MAIRSYSNLLIYDDMYKKENTNPFPSGSLALVSKARSLIMKHPEDYIFVDWKENIHSRDVMENDCDSNYTGTIFGKDVTNKPLSSIPKFDMIVKQFFIETCSRIHISQELTEWATSGNTNITYDNDEDVSYDEENDETTENEEFINENDESANVITYNFSTYETLKLEDVCDLCMSISRNQLITNRKKLVEIEKIEAARKNELIDEILKLYELADLQIENQKDLMKLSIQELEEKRKRYEIKFDNLKVKDVIKTWLSTCSVVYDSVFPSGIPLGKTKRFRIKSIGKQLDNFILNPRTVSGQSFRRILDKKHIKISDEFEVMSKFANILLQNAEIVDVNDIQEETTTEDENEDIEEDSYDEDISEFSQ